jgi:predicted nucleic acid-binding protein
MITAVDSNILIDALTDDPRFAEAALRAIERAQQEGAVVACTVVWAEVAALFAQAGDHSAAMSEAEIVYDPIRAESALTAGALWRAYRQRGGKRERLIGDFLVAAHAIQQADRLLTRDRGFTRRFFPNLIVFDPADA